MWLWYGYVVIDDGIGWGMTMNRLKVALVWLWYGQVWLWCNYAVVDDGPVGMRYG